MATEDEGITAGFRAFRPVFKLAQPDNHSGVCWAAALGYASRRAKDRDEVIERARIALHDGITHCLCRIRQRSRARRGRGR